MAKTNKRIRLKLAEHEMTQYDLSKLMGVSETTIYRRLRDELPDEEQNRIINLIDKGGKE